MFWTPRQRLALSLLILLILCYLLILSRLHPARLSNPQPNEAPRASELEDKVDPNTASAADLSALPNLGPAMARRIIEDREKFKKDQQKKNPYGNLGNLQQKKGIGPATLENLKSYLKFPATQPSA